MLTNVISTLWGRSGGWKSQWQSPLKWLNISNLAWLLSAWLYLFIYFLKTLYWQCHFPLSAVIRSRNSKCFYLPPFPFSLSKRPEAVFYQLFPLQRVLSPLASDFFLLIYFVFILFYFKIVWPIGPFSGSPCQLSFILAAKICLVMLSSLCHLYPPWTYKNMCCKHRIFPIITLNKGVLFKLVLP